MTSVKKCSKNYYFCLTGLRFQRNRTQQITRIRKSLTGKHEKWIVMVWSMSSMQVQGNRGMSKKDPGHMAVEKI